MFGALAKKIFGSANERRLKTYQPKVKAINALEPEVAALSDEALRARTQEFRDQLAAGKTLDDLLAPAFATVREAARRTLGQRHFDVQLIGGMVLHEGGIAEMRTGEGKTLVATLAVYLNALTGKGVHVVTVNDYLAKRDAEWMGQIYNFLGMSVGVIVHDISDEDRSAAYASDITYGTNNEFGFDYLRDNMKYELAQMAQRGHSFAIVDEVDSILIDEARTPLIISGPIDDKSDLYNAIDKLLPKLDQGRLRPRRKAALDQPDRRRQRTYGGIARRGRHPHRGRALRGAERHHRSPRQSGPARAQAVPARQGLHRAQGRGRHHRRIHRPHDGRAAAIRKGCIRRSKPRSMSRSSRKT